MPFPITVISATGKGCAISASNSVANAPVITVPSSAKVAVCMVDYSDVDVFWFVLQGFTVNEFGS